MIDPRSTPISVFVEPREAFGWLASLWAGFLMAALIWPWLLFRSQLFDAHPTAWLDAATTILIVGLGAINIWGYWVASSEARTRLKQAAQQRRLPWWERERFASEHAAERLGWAPGPVVWITRALMLLAASTTLTVLAMLGARWWSA
jgi:hypothetical protein